MTLLDMANQDRAALELTGMIAANPALAEPILKLLKQLGGDVGKLHSLKLSALTIVQDNLPKSQLSTAQTLRAENRIQDDAAILAKLGFKGELPSIPRELLDQCARTGGTLVLQFKTTALQYQASLNVNLGRDKKHLHLSYINYRAESLATTNEEPIWINVPNSVRVDTLGMSKATALNHVPGSATCNPMATILMLGYNNLRTGKQHPGFTNKWTFTDQKNTLVGSDVYGIGVRVDKCYDDLGGNRFGLAPRIDPESKNRSLVLGFLI